MGCFSFFFPPPHPISERLAAREAEAVVLDHRPSISSLSGWSGLLLERSTIFNDFSLFRCPQTLEEELYLP